MGAVACSKQQELLKWQEFRAYKPPDDRNTCFVWANGWLYCAKWLSLALCTFMFSTLITSNSLHPPLTFHSYWDETFLTRHITTRLLDRLYYGVLLMLTALVLMFQWMRPQCVTSQLCCSVCRWQAVCNCLYFWVRELCGKSCSSWLGSMREW